MRRRVAAFLLSLAAAFTFAVSDSGAQRIAPARPAPTIRPAPAPNLGHDLRSPGLGSRPWSSSPSQAPRDHRGGYDGSRNTPNGGSSYQPPLPTWPDAAAYQIAGDAVQQVRQNAPTLRQRLLSSVAGAALLPNDILMAPLPDSVLREALAEAVSGRTAELGGRYANPPSEQALRQFVIDFYENSSGHLEFAAAEARDAAAARAAGTLAEALDGVVGQGAPLSGRTIAVASQDSRAVLRGIPMDTVRARGRPSFYVRHSGEPASNAEIQRELRGVLRGVSQVGPSGLMIISLLPESAEDANVWGFEDSLAREYADAGASLRPSLEALRRAGADIRTPRHRSDVWRAMSQAKAFGKHVVIIGEANARHPDGARALQIPGTSEVLRASDFHGGDKARTIGLFCHSREILGDEAVGFDTLLMSRSAIRAIEAVRIAMRGAHLILPIDSRPDTVMASDAERAGASPFLKLAYDMTAAYEHVGASPGQSEGPALHAYGRDPDADGGFFGFCQRLWWRIAGFFASLFGGGH